MEQAGKSLGVVVYAYLKAHSLVGPETNSAYKEVDCDYRTSRGTNLLHFV